MVIENVLKEDWLFYDINFEALLCSFGCIKYYLQRDGSKNTFNQ